MLIETDLTVTGDQRLMGFLERSAAELANLNARLRLPATFRLFNP